MAHGRKDVEKAIKSRGVLERRDTDGNIWRSTYWSIYFKGVIREADTMLGHRIKKKIPKYYVSWFKKNYSVNTIIFTLNGLNGMLSLTKGTGR